VPEFFNWLDPTLKALEILTIISGVIIAVMRMVQTSAKVEATLKRQNEILEMHSDQMEELKKETKKVAEAFTVLAVTGSRMDRLEQDVRELRHGKGYVLSSK